MTPLMKQYWEIKSQHDDKVLLFRMGDFYEMFHQDAELAAPILGIALTSRNKKAQDETKMCGVPYHSIAGPISKLLAAGHKVAICDQVEDPKEAKGIVKRAVTRILSPGMVYDPSTLDQLSGHYLSSYDSETVSFLEPTTGEFFFYKSKLPSERLQLWQLLRPKEILLTSTQRREEDLPQLKETHWTVVEVSGSSSFAHKSSNLLFEYATKMQGAEIAKTLQSPEEKSLHHRMLLSSTTLRHLEILTTYRGEKTGALLSAIDRTRTASGARLLRNWLMFPLSNVHEIESRLDQVERWVQHSDALKAVREALTKLGDLERRLGKVSNPNCNGRDLLALGQSLSAGLQLLPLCPELAEDIELTSRLKALAEMIELDLVEEPPLATRSGGLIRRGRNGALDELIDLADNGQMKLNEMELQERESTGISSLKIRYNSVFGYYIEVTNTHASKVPSRFQRKQTLANAERYTTTELHELEKKLLSAHARRAEMEWQIFCDLRARALQFGIEILSLARRLSELDIWTALAWLAIEQEYVRPKFSIGDLQVIASRHPVVEQSQSDSFVPNDVSLSKGHSILLTGPNMAGKSTLMRQVAVTALLAQVGSFVPARSAVLPIFDAIYTRIGASDSLSEGLSTFMVEMTETAEILKNATEQSLIILDEIGRGTSTYDGLSLAQSIFEYLIKEKHPMILFATHYHELTSLAELYPSVRNAHMSIQDKGRDLEFLHTLVEGPAKKSYGIQVARKAGLPMSVIQRANSLLSQLEKSAIASPQMKMNFEEVESTAVLIEPQWQELIGQIQNLSLQKMTPLEALNQIAKWQQSLS